MDYQLPFLINLHPLHMRHFGFIFYSNDAREHYQSANLAIQILDTLFLQLRALYDFFLLFSIYNSILNQNHELFPNRKVHFSVIGLHETF